MPKNDGKKGCRECLKTFMIVATLFPLLLLGLLNTSNAPEPSIPPDTD